MPIRHDLKNWKPEDVITAEQLNETVQAVRDVEEHLNAQETSFATGALQATSAAISGAASAGSLNVTGALTRAGNTVYDTGNKPTPADIGAVDRNGGAIAGALTSSKIIKIGQEGWNRVAILNQGGYAQVIVSFSNNWWNKPPSPTTLLVSLSHDVFADIEQLYCARLVGEMAITQARVTNENGLFYLELYYSDLEHSNRYIIISAYGMSDTDYPVTLLDSARPGGGTVLSTSSLIANALNVKGVYDNGERVYSPNNPPRSSGVKLLWSGTGIYTFPDGYGVYLIWPSDTLTIASTRGDGIAMVYVDHPLAMSSLLPEKQCRGYIGTTRVNANAVVSSSTYLRYTANSSGTYKVYKMPS